MTFFRNFNDSFIMIQREGRIKSTLKMMWLVFTLYTKRLIGIFPQTVYSKLGDGPKKRG